MGDYQIIDIFEARKPKEPAVIAEFDGRIEFGKDYKNKKKIILHSKEDKNKFVEYFISRSSILLVSDGEEVDRGSLIIDGVLDLHDILRVRGLEALANYMIIAVQSVYRLQGVKIDSKHIEVIIKHMLQKIEISDPGSTVFSAEEKVSLMEFQKANDRAEKNGSKPAKGNIILSGITRAAAQNSFISAAAFQETTKVLTEAAANGRVDELKSLKENLITGRLIPAGTGLYIKNMKNIQRSKQIDNPEVI